MRALAYIQLKMHWFPRLPPIRYPTSTKAAEARLRVLGNTGSPRPRLASKVAPWK